MPRLVGRSRFVTRGTHKRGTAARRDGAWRRTSLTMKVRRSMPGHALAERVILNGHLVL